MHIYSGIYIFQISIKRGIYRSSFKCGFCLHRVLKYKNTGLKKYCYDKVNVIGEYQSEIDD